jgi:PAS domain-containing protein
MNKDRQRNHLADCDQTLFQTGPQPMGIFDPETLQFLTVNDPCIQIFGYSQPEFQTLPLDNLCSSADLAPLVQQIRTTAQKPLRCFLPLGIRRFHNKEGSKLDIELAGR